MSFEQARRVEETLRHWQADPALQTPELDAILWGKEAKVLAALSGATERGSMFKSAGLEFAVLIEPGAKHCDSYVTFRMAAVHRGANLFRGDCSFSAFNGLPVILSRTTFGNRAGLVVARCTWKADAASSIAASPKENAPAPLAEFDSAANIEVGCRLIEMPSAVADLAEAVLLQWTADPAEQARRIESILSASGVKEVAALSGISRNGQRAFIELLQKPATLIPHGVRPAKWVAEPRDIGVTLEFEPVLHFAKTCDFNCVFHRTLAHDANRRFETVKPTSSVTATNGLSVLLARRDFGTAAELIIARASWDAPADAPPAQLDRAAQVYIRARVVSIAPALAGEAARLKDDPQSSPRGCGRTAQPRP